MRLSGITEADTEQADHESEKCPHRAAAHPLQRLRMRLAHLFDHAAEPAEAHHRNHRQHHQAEHHDEALHEIGPHHRQKSAQHRVQNNDRRADRNA